MMDWNGHMTTGGWIFSSSAIIVILALVVAAIAWIARELSKRRDRGQASAREILDRRLASGEIKTEQYKQLRQTIGVPPGAGSASQATHTGSGVPLSPIPPLK